MSREQNLRPFFIVGSPRSGTTLLRFMLSSHSQLYVPDETGFLPFLHCDPNQLLTSDQMTELLKRIGRLNRFWKGLVPDVVTFQNALPEPRLPFLLDVLYRQQSQIPPSVRWGDKTPLYVRYIPQISAIFPDAQFIHVIRDGRDATLSAYEKWGKTTWYMDHYYLLRNWQRNVQAGQQSGQQVSPNQYITVHYEQLVDDPRQALQEILAFLGEPFETSVLQQSALAKEVGGGIDRHIEAQDQIHKRSIQRWRREMTPFERKLANQLIGNLLLELDYPLTDEGPFSGLEWAKMKFLALKFLLTDSTRNLLYRVGILTLNRNRR